MRRKGGLEVLSVQPNEPLLGDKLPSLDLVSTALALRDTLIEPYPPTPEDHLEAGQSFKTARQSLLARVHLQARRRQALTREDVSGESDRIVSLIEHAERERIPSTYLEEGLETALDDDGIIPEDFLERVVLPCITPLARTQEQFRDLLNLAYKVLEDLLHLETQKGSDSVSRDLISAFFEDGSFTCALKTYGPMGARAVATLRSAKTGNEDPQQMEEAYFEPIREYQLPEGLYMQALRQRARASKEAAFAFVQATKIMVPGLKEAGREDAIPVWLNLVRLMGDRSGYRTPKFLFNDPHQTLKEIDGYLKWAHNIPASKDYFEIWFSESDHREWNFSGVDVHTYVPRPILALATIKLSDADIEHIVAKTCAAGIPASEIDTVLAAYAAAEAKFPGGYDALLEYCTTISSCWAGIAHLCTHIKDLTLSSTQWDVYLKTGKQLVDRFGERANRYFYAEFLLEKHADRLDAADFSAQVGRVADLAETFAKDPYLISGHPVADILYRGVEIILEEPGHLDSFIGGLEIMAAQPIPEDAVERDTWNWHVGHFLHPVTFFSLYNQDVTLLNFDYAHHAQDLLALVKRNEGRYKARQSVENLGPFLKKGAAFELVDDLTAYDVVEPIIARLSEAKLAKDGARLTRRNLEELLEAMALEIAEALVPLGIRKEDISLNDIERQIRELEFQEMMQRATAIIRPPAIVSRSGYFDEAGSTTQMAIMGGTLLHALGILRDPAINADVERIPGARPTLLIGDGEEGPQDEAWIDELRRRIALIMPRVEGQIKLNTALHAGRAPLGGKAHSPEVIDPDRVRALNALFGFGKTGFAMMHHDSILLAPATTPLHMFYAGNLLKLMGIHPETYQVCGQGHWPQEVLEVVASTFLLSGDNAPLYKPGAFTTTQDDLTGSRFMARGKGVLDRNMPYMPPVPEGECRTDVLAQPDLNAFARGHIVNTLVVNALYGGHFHAEGQDFLHRITRILDSSGLRPLAASTGWVKATATDPVDHHEAVIGQFAQRWLTEVRRPNHGLVGEVRGALGEASLAMRARREEVIATDPKMFEWFMRY